MEREGKWSRAKVDKVDNRGYHRGDRIRFATCEGWEAGQLKIVRFQSNLIIGDFDAPE